MRNFVRVIALVLACLFCAMVVVACETVTVQVKDQANTRMEGELLYDEETGLLWAADEWGHLRLYDDLPDDLDYEDEVITVLYWSDVEKQEFEQAEESDESRASAIYNRNLAVEQRLGIKLAWKSTAGNASNVRPFVAMVNNTYTSSKHDYDIIATYSRSAGALCTSGLLYDLQSITDVNDSIAAEDQCGYINLTQPWWPAGLVDDMRIGNHLYFLSGDIACTVIDEMHCVYFNKDLVDTQFEEEAISVGASSATQMLYSYVRDGKWTVDKMVEMSSGYGVDTDNSGTKDGGDKYGMCSASYCACTIYGGANLRMIEPDDAELLKISDNYTSTRTVKLVKTLSTLFRSDDYYDRLIATSSNYYLEPFTSGNALFALQYLELAENSLVGNEAVAHYGLVPLPKYDTAQKNYYTVIGNAFTMYSLFCNFDDRGDEEATAQMLSAILECWASESYRKITPVLFELNMQLKYSETQDETDMCEYVRAGICFDLGRVFGELLGFTGDSQVFDAAWNGESWVASYSSNIENLRSTLKDFCATLNDIN